jgi:hypothetical protein
MRRLRGAPGAARREAGGAHRGCGDNRGRSAHAAAERAAELERRRRERGGAELLGREGRGRERDRRREEVEPGGLAEGGEERGGRRSMEKEGALE